MYTIYPFSLNMLRKAHKKRDDIKVQHFLCIGKTQRRYLMTNSHGKDVKFST